MGNNVGKMAETAAGIAVEAARQHAAQHSGGAPAPPSAVPTAAHEALFFPDPAMPCRHGKECRRQACTFSHDATSLARLLQWLGSAKASLDVCVFTITCDELADALLAAHNRGVRVRVISDNDQVESQGSDIGRLRNAGLPVRTDKIASHMHHKFAVLDNRFLLNGSFNWTRSAVLENEENVLVLDAPAVAATYTAHFERLWSKFA